MPELPEVETTRRQLLSLFEDDIIVRSVEVLLAKDKQLRYPIPCDLNDLLGGTKLMALRRRGKYMIFLFEQAPPLIVHFGMSGWMCVFNVAADLPPHSHVIFNLSNDRRLVFNDSRRFGVVDWARDSAGKILTDWKDDYRIQRMGVEPLTEASIDVVMNTGKTQTDEFTELTAEYMFGIASTRPNVTVKQFLMDYEIVVGIGNIYAAESLFDAKIHPRTRACDLTKEDWSCLIQSAKRILLEAIRAKGTTFRDFKSGTGERGHFTVDLKVYGKSKAEPCSECGKALTSEKISGRTTVYCAVCQPSPSKKRRTE